MGSDFFNFFLSPKLLCNFQTLFQTGIIKISPWSQTVLFSIFSSFPALIVLQSSFLLFPPCGGRGGRVGGGLLPACPSAQCSVLSTSRMQGWGNGGSFLPMLGHHHWATQCCLAASRCLVPEEEPLAQKFSVSPEPTWLFLPVPHRDHSKMGSVDTSIQAPPLNASFHLSFPLLELKLSLTSSFLAVRCCSYIISKCAGDLCPFSSLGP